MHGGLWLAPQVRQADGEALVMHVEKIEGLADQALIALFHQARQEDYAAIDERVTHLAQVVHRETSAQERLVVKDELGGLQRQELLAGTRFPVEISRVGIDAYRDKRWVTRPRPHVDRLVYARLIRRYVNPQAAIRYGAAPAPDEVAFDMPDAEFSHRGELCPFEVMQRALDLDDPALQAVVEIVHEIDLWDGVYVRPETSGVDALPDSEMEARGIGLFDGLYVAFAGNAL